MGIQRRSLFGFPPPAGQQSVVTTRLVPLTQGLKQDVAWPLRPAGSAFRVSEFLPMEGKLVPRSRLSSLNTVILVPSVSGVGLMTYGLSNAAPSLWVSGATLHALLAHSGGSISRASFVSAGGLGSAALLSSGEFWQYAQVYAANLNDNMLVAANNSGQSLICLYRSGGNTGNALYSFLTSAPPAVSVAAFDNYLVAFNITGSANASTRVQWCTRGEPSNWTGEGSGFEDLLEMRGRGTSVKPSEDGRIYLFTTHEIWYGLRAAYPAQFQFYPYHASIGCPAPRTIQATPAGYVFLGSDRQLYLLPKGGGSLQPVAQGLTPILKTLYQTGNTEQPNWGVYDEKTHVYYLAMQTGTVGSQCFAVHLGTGEWSYVFENGIITQADCGVAGLAVLTNAFTPENLYFVSSAGTVFSTKSSLAADRPGSDSTATVTAVFQTTPLGVDLPGNYKQITEVNLDYRSASASTLTLKISGDGGNNYETTGRAVSLGSAPVSGRVQAQTYFGGGFPTIELTSTSTGFELHRLEVTLAIGGRR